MYKCSSPQIIYDPYDVLPPYGESEIKICYDDNKLSLSIFYENDETKEENSIRLEFDSPVFHRFEGFPGVDGMDIECDSYGSLGSLVEFSYSEYRDAWEKHFENMFQFRHYQIFFLSENQRFEVVSKEVRIVQ